MSPPKRARNGMHVSRWYFGAAASYGALTLFEARYGPTTYLALVPVAAAVAFYLRDVEDRPESRWPDAIIGALLLGLLVRDFALYPSSPIRGLPVDGIEVPEAARNPRAAWATVLGLMAITLLLGFGTRARLGERPNFRLLPNFLREQWARGWAFRIWLILGGVVTAAMVVLGLWAWAAGDSMPFTSVVVRTLRIAVFISIRAGRDRADRAVDIPAL